MLATTVFAYVALHVMLGGVTALVTYLVLDNVPNPLSEETRRSLSGLAWLVFPLALLCLWTYMLWRMPTILRLAGGGIWRMLLGVGRAFAEVYALRPRRRAGLPRAIVIKRDPEGP